MEDENDIIDNKIRTDADAKDQRFMDENSGYGVLDSDGSIRMFKYGHSTYSEHSDGVVYKDVIDSDKLVRVISKDHWLWLTDTDTCTRPDTYIYTGTKSVPEAIREGISETFLEKFSPENFECLKDFWRQYRIYGTCPMECQRDIPVESPLPILAKRYTLWLSLVGEKEFYMDYLDLDYLRDMGWVKDGDPLEIYTPFIKKNLKIRWILGSGLYLLPGHMPLKITRLPL